MINSEFLTAWSWRSTPSTTTYTQDDSRPAVTRGEPARTYFWIFALLSAVVLFTPLRSGDLAGYDDALYAHIAKDIARTGDWLNIRSNGYSALEHPPLLPWIEAALFSVFGVSDVAAKLPSAFCGWATIVLVYWAARRLLRDSNLAVAAMVVMATSLYFLKYAARAMTDVPCTFLFLCAICAGLVAEQRPAWYLAAGVFTGLSLLTRGLIGFGLPVIFALDFLIRRRRAPLRFVASAALLAFLPLAAWYAHLIAAHGDFFFTVHAAWLDREVFGALSPEWRRYTGVFEYAIMLAKSYWPWLPFLIVGIVVVVRRRDRRLWLLLIWMGVVLLLCGAAKSRVLRYMLPAYPAFAIGAAIGLGRVVSAERLRVGIRVATPLAATGVLAFAVFGAPRWHATEIRSMAEAATSATRPGERVGFYDSGQPRFDETNQLQWYGDRYLWILLSPQELTEALGTHRAQTYVVDQGTFESYFAGSGAHVVARSGHLVCVSLG